MATPRSYDPEFDTFPRPGSSRRFPFGCLAMTLGLFAALIALLQPAYDAARAAARGSQCVNNLKQIALALQIYEETYQAPPPLYTLDAGGRPLHSWRTLILPYLGEEQLYKSIDLAKPWDDPANRKAAEARVSVYRCPNAVGPTNTTTFLAMAGLDGTVRFERRRLRYDSADDARPALILIEAGDEDAVPWMAPVDASESLVMGLGLASKLHHPGGTNMVFADGGVRSMPASASKNERRRILTGSENPGAK